MDTTYSPGAGWAVDRAVGQHAPEVGPQGPLKAQRSPTTPCYYTHDQYRGLTAAAGERPCCMRGDPARGRGWSWRIRERL